MTAGAVSGQAGAAVNLSVSFDPGTASVSALQFDLTMPPGLNAGSAAAGAIVGAAGKSLEVKLSGNAWKFIVFGFNKNVISAGTLLTARVGIAPSTKVGALKLPISHAVYSGPNGEAIASGASKGGVVIVNPSVPKRSDRKFQKN